MLHLKFYIPKGCDVMWIKSKPSEYRHDCNWNEANAVLNSNSPQKWPHNPVPKLQMHLNHKNCQSLHISKTLKFQIDETNGIKNDNSLK